MEDEDLHQVDSVLDLASTSSTVLSIFGSDDVPSSSGDISVASNSSSEISSALLAVPPRLVVGPPVPEAASVAVSGRVKCLLEEQQGSDVGVHVSDREEERDGGRRCRRAWVHDSHVRSRGRVHCLWFSKLRRDLAFHFFAVYDGHGGSQDTDVIWLRNPFPRLNPNETIDLQISTDVFYGNVWSKSNKINTGFYMIRTNNKTIALFDNWYAKKDKSTGMKEEDVLELLLHEGVFKGLGLRLRFLDTLFFSGFCQKSSDVSAVVTVHANCCRSISAKLIDLMDFIHHWKTFKNLPTNETLTIEWSRHLACINSWKF
ncbi:unnamed protein product [Camellia sinensis]